MFIGKTAQRHYLWLPSVMKNHVRMVKSADRKGFCTVLVLYEDVATRERGLVACDYLVKKFWAEFEFEFHWWRTDFLADPILAAAAERANRANLIFLCSAKANEPSATIRQWFDRWVDSRPEREGLLIDLPIGDQSVTFPAAREKFLRDISRRADLDYLGTFPQTLPGTFPPSVPVVELEANPMASILDGLLNEPPPPHFGIND